MPRITKIYMDDLFLALDSAMSLNIEVLTLELKQAICESLAKIVTEVATDFIQTASKDQTKFTFEEGDATFTLLRDAVSFHYTGGLS